MSTVASLGKLMTSKLDEVPIWLKQALRGVVCWIGHRRCLYRHYPLTEGAIVAELCNLIAANLPSDMRLHCEEMYRDLDVPADSEITKQARTDLTIRDTNKSVKFIFEVKRGTETKAKIESDLRRLISAKRANPNIRTFSLVISEGHRPQMFVSEKGKSWSSNRMRKIERCDGYYRIRSVQKISHSFEKVEKGHYACALECFVA